ncbi:hypothetical protein [Nonomuraea soli]|uniref:hypothetical protein n=1 Tax=Nonomuraea soli TaxID=1032476 RepID=UPI0031F01593
MERLSTFRRLVIAKNVRLPWRVTTTLRQGQCVLLGAGDGVEGVTYRLDTFIDGKKASSRVHWVAKKTVCA